MFWPTISQVDLDALTDSEDKEDNNEPLFSSDITAQEPTHIGNIFQFCP